MNQENRKGYCYLIWAIDTSLFKIGFSSHPMSRFSSIQTSSPIPLKFLGAVPATIEEEQNAHCVLAQWHFKGEWFSLPVEIAWLLMPIFDYKPMHVAQMTDVEWKTYCTENAKRCVKERFKPDFQSNVLQQHQFFD